MDKILNFQISFFGSFSYLKPDQEVIAKLMEALKEENMLPTTTTVSTIDTANKNIITEDRLRMVSLDKKWSINFLKDRIDINYNYDGGNEIFNSLSDVFLKSKVILNSILNHFNELQGNRLALNSKILLNELSSDERNDFINKFSKHINSFIDAPLEEWYTRYNYRKGRTIFSNKVETCNNIIELGDIDCYDIKTEQISKRLFIGFDVNTLPENDKMRFQYNNLKDFIDNLEEDFVEMFNEIDGD